MNIIVNIAIMDDRPSMIFNNIVCKITSNYSNSFAVQIQFLII